RVGIGINPISIDVAVTPVTTPPGPDPESNFIMTAGNYSDIIFGYYPGITGSINVEPFPPYNCSGMYYIAIPDMEETTLGFTGRLAYGYLRYLGQPQVNGVLATGSWSQGGDEAFFNFDPVLVLEEGQTYTVAFGGTIPT